MYFSKYNIFTKLEDSENYLLMNLLTGNADILTKEKADEIIKKNYTDIEEYESKGYITTEEKEKQLYKKKYLDFLDARDNEEIQIFFVPNYSCNFTCSYCYQSAYQQKSLELSEDITEAFFDYIDKEFAGRKKYITIFGGEPLLNTEKSKQNIKSIIEKANKRDLDIAVVTNGYYLEEYMDILKNANIREIQVTLDGTKETHNKRRKINGKSGTFEKIAAGIDKCLENNLPVNLRMVVDKENLYNLPDLADFSIKKGWTKNKLFKTQIGRNYNLHTCNTDTGKLFSRIELYREIYKLLKKHPSIIEFHKPAFSVSKFLFENGELPDPLFDSCPGCKSEWAFDFTGGIYPCTATVGKKDEQAGTFYPAVTKNEDLIFEWQDRDTTSINECIDCALQFSCGGGCASVAKNSTGSLHSPDCRPVKELLALGIPAYFEE